MELTEFKQLEGKPHWIEQQQRYLSNSVWQFNPDGTFAWAAEGFRTDLLPVQGTYTVSGSQWDFTGNNSSAIGGNRSFVEIIGSLDVSSSTMIMTVASGAGYGAVINDQPIGTTASTAYEGKMTVTVG
ncbi:hypothetical protein ABZ070_14475 [Streptomyces sp. NPDC006283]|uniref:hypothetical protein n=1 Tax=Streptomyces sp. NPDC006283 TaxID=3156741 RepID=UPI00339FBFB8